MTSWTGSFKGAGLRFLRSSIWEESSSIAFWAMMEICCPTVLMGMTASSEMGELSNPMIR